MEERLGKARLDLTADVEPFRRNMADARRSGDEMQHALDAIAAVARVAEANLNQVKLDAATGAKSNEIADRIERSVGSVGRAAMEASRHLEQVKLSQTSATESVAAGERIKRNLNDVGDEADRTKRKLAEVKLAGGPTGRSGVGVGPFGSGFGRIGVLGTAIGLGALTAPAAGPGAAGLLAAMPLLGAGAVGSVGTLALAFSGVAKAIEGDKKAFQDLEPAQQSFVLSVRSLDGWLDKLKQTAGSNLFPGLDKALHETLSPGTVAAISTAVAGLAHALGLAGEEWGRYFGSPEFQQVFGPLMHEAARNIGQLSDTMLHLFDALSVVGRAAIPFTDWMMRGIDAGSRLADQWLRAKDATGALGGAMSEAETSLRLVGGLLGALLHAVGALAIALYPVAKIAVKDLTDGLNALAGIIQRNQGEIRDIVGGALQALVGAVKIAYPLVANLAHAATDLAHAVGGWRNAFAIILSGLLAKQLLAVGLSLGGVSTEAAAAMGSVGRLQASLLGLSRMGPIIIAIGLDYFVNKYGLSNSIQAGLNPTVTLGPGIAHDVINPLTGQIMGTSADKLAMAATQAVTSGAGQHGALRKRAVGVQSHYTKQQLAQLWIQAGGDPSVANMMADIAYRGESSGNVRATNTNTNGTIDRGLWQINSIHGYGLSSFNALENARQAVAIYKSQGLAAWTDPVARAYMASGGSSPFGPPPPWTTNTGAAAKPAQPTGMALLSQGLQAALAHAKNMVTQTQGATAAHWLQVELADLEKARKQLKQLEGEGATGKRKTAIVKALRSIDHQIATVNKDITSNLHQQASAVKSSFSQRISSQKAQIANALGTIKSALDAQFEQQTQAYIDNVLAPRYFQGSNPLTGAPRLTPLEQQLADMQAADQLASLQSAVGQAKTPEEKKAAQRALDEYQLQIRATRERQQADADYARAVKKYQAERTDAENRMNAALDLLSKGLQDGTKNLGDLAQIASDFGVSLTADDGIITDFSILQDATRTLARTMAEEAARLAALGDSKDANAAQRIADMLGGLTQGHGSGTQSGGGLGVGQHGGPIAMAAGALVMPRPGGTIARLAEAGIPEAVLPLPDGLRPGFVGASALRPAGDIILKVNERELGRASIDAITRDRVGTLKLAKAVKPATGRVVSVGG